MSAYTSYQTRLKILRENIGNLQTRLFEHHKQAKANPDDYAYLADLSYVQSQIVDASRFLGSSQVIR